MTTKTKGLGTALLTTALLAAPAALQAQVTATPDDEARVEALRERAETEASSKDGFLMASLLFRRAAHIQGNQPAAVHDLVQAARLAYYAGREGDALDDLVQAGRTALEWGDVVTAASAWLDAAWVAVRDGDNATALEFATRAERLSHSPLIERMEREAILSRLTDFDG